jgi:hypothetical protein
MNDEADAVVLQATAARIVRQMAGVGLSPPSGCATLALAYAMWVEREPEATEDLLRAMQAQSLSATREAFRLLRRMREFGDAAIDGALRTME